MGASMLSVALSVYLLLRTVLVDGHNSRLSGAAFSCSALYLCLFVGSFEVAGKVAGAATDVASRLTIARL